MTKPLRPAEKTLPTIRDTASTLPRIDPAQVQQALGAEEVPAAVAEAMAPLTLATEKLL